MKCQSIPIQEMGLGTVSEMTYLCENGRKTLTQSINAAKIVQYYCIIIVYFSVYPYPIYPVLDKKHCPWIR